MVISLPIPISAKKESTEKVLEVNIPNVAEKVRKNKYLSAFRTVLSAPVK